MPYKFETDKKIIPRKLRRTVKLTFEQREEIKRNEEGMSNYQLAAKYGVSKRLIQFIRHPERQIKNLLDREKRGGTMKYYDKEKHKDSMKDYRHYKKTLAETGKLIEGESNGKM